MLFDLFSTRGVSGILMKKLSKRAPKKGENFLELTVPIPLPGCNLHGAEAWHQMLSEVVVIAVDGVLRAVPLCGWDSAPSGFPNKASSPHK